MSEGGSLRGAKRGHHLRCAFCIVLQRPFSLLVRAKFYARRGFPTCAQPSLRSTFATQTEHLRVGQLESPVLSLAGWRAKLAGQADTYYDQNNYSGLNLIFFRWRE